MVSAGVFGEINRASKTTPFRIVCSVDHPTNAGLHQSSRAHWAWFQRHDQGALVQSPVAENQGCLAQSHEFRMSEWI